jgi:hypothetical protein
MTFNRNNYLMFGVLLLSFGVQLHFFDTFELTETASKVYYEKIERTKRKDTREIPRLFSAAAATPFPRKIIAPPKWLGWPFISVGAVLVFQAICVRRNV